MLFNAIALLATSTAILCFRLLERRAARREAAQPWHTDHGDRAAFLALFPLMVLFGQPRERRRGHAARVACKIATYLLVAGGVVWIGYALLQQGPLAVVPYVLFPFAADTVLRGERIAINLRDYLRAFWSGQPWREWRRSGIRAK